MTTPRQRLSARDYKDGGRRGGGAQLDVKQFGYGLACGLAVALGVFLFDHRAHPQPAEATPKPQAAKTATDDADEAAGRDAEDPGKQYDFYDMLPKFEVVIPEKERDVRRDDSSAPVEQPGAYVLQVGSYRGQAEAEQLRAKLAKQGIDAAVQKVAIDADTWYRVRIGPFRDLARLNTTRRGLRAADVDAIVIRLGD